MKNVDRYYDNKGRAHTVEVRYGYGSIIIYYDGAFYTNVDDRAEANEAIEELIKYKKLSIVPKMRKKKRLVT